MKSIGVPSGALITIFLLLFGIEKFVEAGPGLPDTLGVWACEVFTLVIAGVEGATADEGRSDRFEGVRIIP